MTHPVSAADVEREDANNFDAGHTKECVQAESQQCTPATVSRQEAFLTPEAAQPVKYQRPLSGSIRSLEQLALIIARGSLDSILAVLVKSNFGYRLISLDERDSLELEPIPEPPGVDADGSSGATETNLVTRSAAAAAAAAAASKYLVYIPDEKRDWKYARLEASDLLTLLQNATQAKSANCRIVVPVEVSRDAAEKLLNHLMEGRALHAVPPADDGLLKEVPNHTWKNYSVLDAKKYAQVEETLAARPGSSCGSRTLAGSRASCSSYVTASYDSQVSDKDTAYCVDIKEPGAAATIREKAQASTTTLSSPSTGTSIINEKVAATPDKNGSRPLRFLRFQLFSIYRRLFSLVFLGNLATLFALLARKHPRGWPRIADLSTAVSANLAVTIFIRQEHVVNLLFSILCSFPLSAPLWIRKWSAKVYHLGGLHSGCAVAALCWFVVFTAAITRDFVLRMEDEIVREPAVLVVTYMILALLIAIILLALPRFRRRCHNSFEAMHRFGGWTALVLLWLQVVFLSDATRKVTPGAFLGRAVATNPSFWLLLAATCSIIYPWLRLRRVKVRAEVLSDHALRLDFDYTTSGVGSAVRLSDRPLKEWHAFAAFSKPNTSGFSVVVSNAGDWTRKQIQKPPGQIWVRGIPTSGVLRVSTAFKRIVLVATGSGIGPCLSVIYSRKVPCRILWSTPHPLETFGPEITNAVMEADPEAIIHNTRTMGKPDMVALAYQLYVESQAEAVVVISNAALTKKVVYGMESRGVPAYGPIWDS